ncbi:MAG: LAGLIDADG family homing endonuclease [Nanoarchaeota archaeon]
MIFRLNKEEKNKIEIFVKNNYSLNRIANQLGKSKSTIYYHFFKLRGRTIQKQKIITANEEIKGEFIGLFAGDGCLDKTADYKYRIYLFFNIKEKNLVEKIIKNNLHVLFSKKPMIFMTENKIIICFYSKAIKELIMKYLRWDKKYRKGHTVHLINNKQSKKFMVGFLRGSIDSDGYISRNKIVFASISPLLIRDIAKFLNVLRIEHQIYEYDDKRGKRKRIYHIYVKKHHQNKFVTMVKPRKVGT